VQQDAMIDDGPPPAGHNRPPPYDAAEVEKLREIVAEWSASATAWERAGTLRDKDEAEALNKFVVGLRDLYKRVDEAKKKAAAPHTEALDATRAVYDKLADAVKKISGKVKPMLDAFVKAEAERAKAEAAAKAARLMAEAQEARRKAEILAQSGDALAEAEAAAEVKAAEKAAMKAVKAEAAGPKVSLGGGSRAPAIVKLRKARVTDLRKAFIRFENDPRVHDAILACASEVVRAKDYDGAPIPGVEVYEEESVR
jgi:hypothetical protein